MYVVNNKKNTVNVICKAMVKSKNGPNFLLERPLSLCHIFGHLTRKV